MIAFADLPAAVRTSHDSVVATRATSALRTAARPAPTIAGWPISRLRLGAVHDTYKVLKAQAALLEPIHDGSHAQRGPALDLGAPPRYELGLRSCEALIIVPPWADLNRPALGPHVLQACARAAGLSVSVLYANVLLAAAIGEVQYQSVAYAPQAALLGEGLFSRCAFGLPRLEERAGAALDAVLRQTSSKMKHNLEYDWVRGFEDFSPRWVRAVADAVLAVAPRVVGATTTFEQTAASVALLNEIKRLSPNTLTVLGGANCESEMAAGIASLGAAVDHIFSGESEASFVQFLRDLPRGLQPQDQIVTGPLVRDLDELPTVSYTQWYQQRRRFLSFNDHQIDDVWLSYETSRGCWWGEKHHCTFCGLNGTSMALRQKSPERVLRELKELLPEHPSRSVWMVDNIMPHGYFSELLPRIADALPGLHIYWDQKSNLSLKKVMALKAAGVGIVQPGIEALSTELLRHMNKGVSARRNLATLRYTRSVGLADTWNLLFAFPHDREGEYDTQLRLLPLLRHLQPPTWLARVNIDRFSPYFSRHEEFGVRRLRPHPAYEYAFPAHADLRRLAYHFVGDYPTAFGRDPERLRALAREFDAWRAAWRRPGAPPPTFSVTRLDRNRYLIIDTRELAGVPEAEVVSHARAMIALAGPAAVTVAQDDVAWALARHAVAEVDGRIVPLATAEPELLREAEC